MYRCRLSFLTHSFSAATAFHLTLYNHILSIYWCRRDLDRGTGAYDQAMLLWFLQVPCFYSHISLDCYISPSWLTWKPHWRTGHSSVRTEIISVHSPWRLHPLLLFHSFDLIFNSSPLSQNEGDVWTWFQSDICWHSCCSTKFDSYNSLTCHNLQLISPSSLTSRVLATIPYSASFSILTLESAPAHSLFSSVSSSITVSRHKSSRA